MKKAAKKPAKKTAKPAATKAAGAKRAASQTELIVPASLKAIADVFAGTAGVTVEKGWGSSSVVLKVRGKIFVMLLGGDLIFKLPSARVDELVEDGATRFDPRKDGRVMREWAVVAAGARNRTTLAREALEFVPCARATSALP
jgi:hypothetical protein